MIRSVVKLITWSSFSRRDLFPQGLIKFEESFVTSRELRLQMLSKIAAVEIGSSRAAAPNFNLTH